MSLPKYPEYKSGDSVWINPVPIHWQVLTLSRVLEDPITDGPHTTPTFCDLGVPFLSVDGIQAGELVFDGCRFISEEDHVELSRKASPRRNDILMGKAASIGKIARVKTDMAFSIWSPLALIRVSEMCVPEFAEYVLKSPLVQAQVETLANSNTQLNIGMKDIPKLRFSLPPSNEQAAIAAFLDRETGKIDALIAEQEKLIALLAEKRQATISHAVTRGLNPNAPMKDSGVAWLGEVPAHWEVKSLKHVIFSSKAGPFGSAITKDMYVDAGYRVYGQEQVIPADFSKGDYFITEDKYSELRQYAVAPGDILISCVGTFGKIAIVPNDVHPGVINPRLIRLRVASDISANFLVMVLRSSVVFEQFSLLSRGGTMDVINIGTLSGINLAVPPPCEQVEIVGFVDHETTKFDVLGKAAERATDLLKERRSALIAAAVTGQIDVRQVA